MKPDSTAAVTGREPVGRNPRTGLLVAPSALKRRGAAKAIAARLRERKTTSRALCAWENEGGRARKPRR
jgi:hypothetical protein